MRTLELKDICGYLPYGLCVNVGGCDTIRLYCISSISRQNSIIALPPKEGQIRFVKTEISQITPILRPLSDLDKTITHNGEEIVPIVECAKMAKFNIGFKADWIFDKEDYGYVAVCCDNRLEFQDGCFWAWVDTGQKMQPNRIFNHYQLYDYLHELKIDYRGLIEAGLAVSVYDLESNPYK